MRRQPKDQEREEERGRDCPKEYEREWESIPLNQTARNEGNAVRTSSVALVCYN